MLTLIVFSMFLCHLVGLWVTGRRLRGFDDTFRNWHYGIILAALVAHSLYWVLETQAVISQSRIPSGWFLWANLGSWCAVAGLFVKLHRQKYLIFNYFIVPIAMAIFMIAYRSGGGVIAGNVEDFDFHRVFWRWVHSGSLLVGTLIMIFSFTAGSLYLIQSFRLKGKQKRLPLRLPSLERLCSMGEQGMLAAFLAFFLGLISGIVMNLTGSGSRPVVNWNDPIIFSSGVILVWITVVCLFSIFYRPARHGRKVAYLSITSGVMVAIEVLLVVLSGHGKPEVDAKDSSDQEIRSTLKSDEIQSKKDEEESHPNGSNEVSEGDSAK